MATRSGVVPQPAQEVVVGDQQTGRDQYRQFRGEDSRLEKPVAIRPNELDIMDQSRRHRCVEGAAVEGLEDPVIGPLIRVLWGPHHGSLARLWKGGLKRQPPL